MLDGQVKEAWAGRGVLDFSEGPATLWLKGSTLLARRAGQKQESTSLGAAGLVLLGHPGVKLNQQVMAEMLRHGVAVAVVDADGVPQGMLVPLGTRADGLWSAQLRADRRLRAGLWAKLVRAKLAAQAAELKAVGAGPRALARLAEAVKPGDPTGIEGRAERRFHQGLVDVALVSARSLAETFQSGDDQFRPAGTPADHQSAQEVFDQLCAWVEEMCGQEKA